MQTRQAGWRTFDFPKWTQYTFHCVSPSLIDSAYQMCTPVVS